MYLLLASLGDFVCLATQRGRAIAKCILAHFLKFPPFLRIGETGFSWKDDRVNERGQNQL